MLEVVKDEKIVYFLSINTVTLQKEKTLLMSRFCSFFFFFPSWSFACIYLRILSLKICTEYFLVVEAGLTRE